MTNHGVKVYIFMLICALGSDAIIHPVHEVTQLALKTGEGKKIIHTTLSEMGSIYEGKPSLQKANPLDIAEELKLKDGRELQSARQVNKENTHVNDDRGIESLENVFSSDIVAGKTEPGTRTFNHKAKPRRKHQQPSPRSEVMSFKARKGKKENLSDMIKLRSHGENGEYLSDPGIDTCPTNCRCRRSGQHHEISVVDCSRSSLSKIPQLPIAAVEVYLDQNHFRDIPCESFSHLKRLKILDISGNPQLASLSPCSFNISESLETLRLGGCSLNVESFPDDVFDQLSQLIDLDLSYNNVSDIKPRVLKNFQKLQRLDLSFNHLAQIRNDTFRYLASLRYLSLQSNLLRYWKETFDPASFRGLLSLESLNLQGNEPGSSDVIYPDQALALLPWLRKLELDGYSQRPLGKGFSTLNNLTRLSFGSYNSWLCQMGDPPLPKEFFSNLTTREPLHLIMSRCGLKDIHPDMFSWLPTLFHLDVSQNRELSFSGFEKFSKGLEHSTIEILNLSDISVILGHMPNMINDTNFRYLKSTRLRMLLLESNTLFYVSPLAMMDLPQTLDYLSFYNNVIQRIEWYSGVEANLINLKTLDISRQSHITNAINSTFVNSGSISGQNNRKNASSDLIPFAESEEINTNHSFEISNTKYANYAQLNFAWAQSSVLLHQSEALDQDAHEDIQNSSDFCQQGRGPLFFPLPTHLEYFYLNDMGWDFDIPPIFILGNEVLKDFEYSKNHATCLSGPFFGMPELEFLDISENNLIRLNPLAFQNLSSLRTLFLHGNVLGQALADDVTGATFSPLISLKTLNLNNNAIKDLSPVAFAYNHRLETLDLSRNQLRQFIPRLVNASRLQTLDLSVNILEGFSEQACADLSYIKAQSVNFSVLIRNNRFTCGCGSIPFLHLLVHQPDIFADVDHFRCTYTNGSDITYGHLRQFLATLQLNCIEGSLFTFAVCLFATSVGCWAMLSLYYYKRWELTYLYYVGRRRVHLEANYITRAQVFLTFNQGDMSCHRLIYEEVCPRLERAGISYLLSSRDFVGVPLIDSIAEAVTNTRMTLVFLSSGIFEDYVNGRHREREVNFAITHEIYMRRPVLVPVLLLRQGNGFGAGPRAPPEPHLYRDQNAFAQDEEEMFDEAVIDVVEEFPEDILAFLRMQAHRCLFYDTSPAFWARLIEVIREGNR